MSGCRPGEANQIWELTVLAGQMKLPPSSPHQYPRAFLPAAALKVPSKRRRHEPKTLRSCWIKSNAHTIGLPAVDFIQQSPLAWRGKWSLAAARARQVKIGHCPRELFEAQFRPRFDEGQSRLTDALARLAAARGQAAARASK